MPYDKLTLRYLDLFRHVIELAATEASNGDSEARLFFTDNSSNFRTMCDYLGVDAQAIAQTILVRSLACDHSKRYSRRAARRSAVLPLFTDTALLQSTESPDTAHSTFCTVPADMAGSSPVA